MLAGEDSTLQRTGEVLQLTDDPLGPIHSPPLKVELGDTHITWKINLKLSSWKYVPLA